MSHLYLGACAWIGQVVTHALLKLSNADEDALGASCITDVLAHQPHFRNQPADVQVFWGYSLFSDRVGNFVPKPMAECNGAEILQELCGHLRFDLETIESANCIPCGVFRMLDLTQGRTPSSAYIWRISYSETKSRIHGVDILCVATYGTRAFSRVKLAYAWQSVLLDKGVV